MWDLFLGMIFREVIRNKVGYKHVLGEWIQFQSVKGEGKACLVERTTWWKSGLQLTQSMHEGQAQVQMR